MENFRFHCSFFPITCLILQLCFSILFRWKMITKLATLCISLLWWWRLRLLLVQSVIVSPFAMVFKPIKGETAKEQRTRRVCSQMCEKSPQQSIFSANRKTIVWDPSQRETNFRFGQKRLAQFKDMFWKLQRNRSSTTLYFYLMVQKAFLLLVKRAQDVTYVTPCLLSVALAIQIEFFSRMKYDHGPNL